MMSDDLELIEIPGGAREFFSGQMSLEMRQLAEQECDHECAWVKPYGWVPEAGCPIHD